LDIHLLKTFVAAYEEANFTKAAKRLNATQPGVSAQIAALEADVGASLFDRNARCVTPTAAGRHLYPRAVQLIHDLNSARLTVRSLSGAATRRVAFGIPPTLGGGVIARVLPRFLEAYPSAEVQIVQEFDSRLTAMIDNRELDVAFVTHPDDRSSVACHKIAAARSMEMDCLAATLDLVANSDWIAVLPAAASYDSAGISGVRFSPIAGDDIGLDYYSVHARTEPMSVATKAFIDMLTVEINHARKHWQSLTRPSAPQRQSFATGVTTFGRRKVSGSTGLRVCGPSSSRAS
jgi:DNA-binding transcriptional LysR family regulator